MQRSLADVSALTRVIAAAIAASACGGEVRASGSGPNDGGVSIADGAPADDATISDAAAGYDAEAACDFEPDAVAAVAPSDCGAILANVSGPMVPPNVDPSAAADVRCWSFDYRPNLACCGAQVVNRYGCQVCGMLGRGQDTCALSATDPCVTDIGEAADACAGWCAAVAPDGSLVGPYGCYLEPWDGSGPIIGDCLPDGPGCFGTGRPPRSFRPRRTRGSSRTASQLATAAQLEAASVCAFEVLACDLQRFGAPRALVASARRAAADEARHARAMRRAAKLRGCTPPRVRAKAASATSLLALAMRNAEEGCVRETFGAAVALIQARTARDPMLRRTLHRIARDEIRHAALSWRLQEWFLSRLATAERPRLATVRRRALDDMDAELAAFPLANPELGLPGPPALRSLLGQMALHLTS